MTIDFPIVKITYRDHAIYNGEYDAIEYSADDFTLATNNVVGHLIQHAEDRVIVAYEAFEFAGERKVENVLVIDIKNIIKMSFLKEDREVKI